jgi:hypothetical protein
VPDDLRRGFRASSDTYFNRAIVGGKLIRRSLEVLSTRWSRGRLARAGHFVLQSWRDARKRMNRACGFSIGVVGDGRNRRMRMNSFHFAS